MTNTGSGYSVADAVITEAAQDLTSTKQEIEGDIAALRSQLMDLNGTWQGAGANAFRSAFTAWEGSASRVVQAMDTFRDNLTVSETTYQETEESVAGAMNKYAALGGGSGRPA